jgi:hypothetical protein
MVYKPKKNGAKPKTKHAVMKYHYKKDPKTGKLRRVTPSGKPWKPYKHKPKPFIIPRDPKTGKRKKFDKDKMIKKLRNK